MFDGQAVHVPSVIVSHGISQPFVAFLSASTYPASHVTAEHPLATMELQAVHVPSVTAAHTTTPERHEAVLELYVPIGHVVEVYSQLVAPAMEY